MTKLCTHINHDYDIHGYHCPSCGVQVVAFAQGNHDEREKQQNKTDALLIEHIIDKHGIAWVLMTISGICGDKAKHIAENWQDTDLAKRWATLEGAVGIIVPRAGGL